MEPSAKYLPTRRHRRQEFVLAGLFVLAVVAAAWLGKIFIIEIGSLFSLLIILPIPSSVALLSIKKYFTYPIPRTLRMLLYLMLGIFVWFLPYLIIVKYGFTPFIHNRFYLPIFFGQSLIIGTGLHMQEKFEKLLFRQSPERYARLSFRYIMVSLRRLTGAAFVYVSYLAYCIPAVLIKFWFEHSEEEGLVFYLLLPAGFVVCLLMGMANGSGDVADSREPNMPGIS